MGQVFSLRGTSVPQAADAKPTESAFILFIDGIQILGIRPYSLNRK